MTTPLVLAGAATTVVGAPLAALPTGALRVLPEPSVLTPALVAVLVGVAVLIWRPASPQDRDVGPGRTPVGLAREQGVAGGEPDALDTAAAMDLLSLSLRSGVGVVEGIRTVAEQLPDPLGSELRTVSTAMLWGVDDAAAWGSVPVSRWGPAAQALRLASQAGVPPADLLVQAAADQRREEHQRLDLEAARLSVRLVLPLGLAFLPAFVLMAVLPMVITLATEVLGQL